MASLNHVGLTVTDLDASVAFYVDVVGMRLVLQGFRTGGEWFDTLTENTGAVIDAALLSAGETTLQLVQYREAGHPEAVTGHNRVGNLHLSFDVEDVEARHAQLKDRPELRATVVVELPVEGYKSFYVRDPDGVPVEFMEPSKSLAERGEGEAAAFSGRGPMEASDGLNERSAPRGR
jgi:catechol 2,3-dioxygenase-like lactoylglutathione lyase family enzyme